MRMFQRSVQIPLAPGVTLLLSTAFPKGRSVSEDTFGIYSPNSPGRKKITNHTLANPNPRGTLGSSIKHLVRERWSSERFTAYIHPVHILSPEGSLTWRVLCHFSLLLQDFAEDVLSCAGALSCSVVAVSGTAAHLPGTAVIFFFSPLLHLNISTPSPRWALILFLLVSFSYHNELFLWHLW